MMPITLVVVMTIAFMGSVVVCDPQQRQSAPGNAIPVFDDAIFDTPKADTASDTIENAEGKKRYKGKGVNYNTKQQEEWVARCSIGNEKGSPAYRECYQKEKGRARDGVQANRDSVEKRMEASESPIPLVEEVQKGSEGLPE